MQDKFRVHDAARIRTGKYAGLVGTVTDTRSDGDKQTQVRVNAEGVRDGVPEGPGLANELEGAISMAVGIMGPLFPTVVGIYTPEVTKAVSGSVAAVCEKHGWLQDGLMGRYGEEIACMAVVGPVAFATYKAVQTDIAARQPAQPASVPGEINLSAPVPVDAPGAKTVSVGVAV